MPYDWTINLHDGTVTGVADDADAGLPDLTLGETATFNFEFGTNTSKHQQVLSIRPYAGDYVSFEPIQGDPMYRDQSPDNSLLVGVDAQYQDGSAPDPSIPRVWGVVDTVEDTTPDDARVPRRIALDVFVLAYHDDYADRAAVQSALEAQGP